MLVSIVTIVIFWGAESEVNVLLEFTESSTPSGYTFIPDGLSGILLLKFSIDVFDIQVKL